MTTKRQIKRLVQPLLERNPELVLDGQWLYFRPVRHLLRTLLFDRTGQADLFEPRWAAMILFDPSDIIDIKYGRRLSPGGRLRGELGNLWYWDDPRMPEVLFDVIENEALPAMRSIETIDDFVEYTSFPDRFRNAELPAFPYLTVPIDVARGDLKSARATCDVWRDRLSRFSPEDPTVVNLNTLGPLLAANDVPALVNQLHAWEEYTVRQLKLEKIWERTPFPIELKGGAVT
jgi:hypothetical protein